jgi:hypothetical protein
MWRKGKKIWDEASERLLKYERSLDTSGGLCFYPAEVDEAYSVRAQGYRLMCLGYREVNRGNVVPPLRFWKAPWQKAHR